MRFSPRATTRRAAHPENGAPQALLDERAAYHHEVDRLASAIAAKPSIDIGRLCLNAADALIEHDGRDDGFAQTVLAYGGITEAALTAWRTSLDIAVGVGEVDLSSALRLLARFVFASDLERQANEFDDLHHALRQVGERPS
ncbi:MAG: hypothetical protein H6835_18510 [Planctomycetes bacterium]|nr:hypothetical protein [Planctomycetota bacterium]